MTFESHIGEVQRLDKAKGIIRTPGRINLPGAAFRALGEADQRAGKAGRTVSQGIHRTART